MLPVVTRPKRIAVFVAALVMLNAAMPLFAFAGVVSPIPSSYTDVIVGRGNKGPFVLSYTNIDPSDIVVVLSGRTLKKGDNYNVDCAKGVMSFTANVLSDSIVRVTYSTTAKSLANSGKVNVPVSLNVFQGQSAKLNVTGLYAEDDPNKPNAAKTVIGLGGEKSWGAGSVSSQIFLSQREDSDKGSTWDRSAFKIGTENTIGALKFTGSILKSGDEFAGGAETGMGVGRDATNMALTFNPNAKVQASIEMQDSQDTAGQAKGNISSSQKQNVTYAVTDASKVAITHVKIDSATAAAGSNRSVDSNEIKFDTKIGAQTTATAVAGTATNVAGNVTENVQTQGVSVASGNTTGQVNFAQKQTQVGGGQSSQEQAMGVAVSTKPTDQVKLDVTYGTLENDRVGSQSSQSAKISVAPLKQVTVNAAVDNVESSVLGQNTRTDIGFQVNPAGNVQIQGHLLGNENNDTMQYQRDFSIISKPADFAKFTASFSQKGVNMNDDVAKGATLELQAFANTQVTAGYRYIETGASVMTIKDYAATSAPCKFLSLSGSMRDRAVANDAAVDSSAMQMALSPFSFFSLTGGYTANPEDAKGQVQNFNSTSVGMRMTIGTLGVTSDYGAKNEYMARRVSNETKLGVDLPVFGHGRLSTGYKMSRVVDGSELSANTYLLGYKHDMGSAFNLSFTGFFTRYLQDGVSLPDKREYSAEASLGLKF